MDRQTPGHVAIILDGNGRWAIARGKPRVFGHYHGALAVGPVVEAALTSGVKVLSLFAFSTENWARPAREVAFLWNLPVRFLVRARRFLDRHQIRLVWTGLRERVPPKALTAIEKVCEATKGHAKMVLNLCMNYGGRQDILQAAARMKTAADAASFEALLLTAPLPPVDLLVRTGGEKRLSNFLLWQCAYAELVFCDTLWPEYTPDAFKAHLAEFAARERRFGALAPAARAKSRL